MAFSVGKVCDLIELYAGQAGVSKDKLNRELLWELLNQKAREFARRSGALESKATISSVASQMEYQLAEDMQHILRVHFDDYFAHKTTANKQPILADKVS